MRNFLLIIFSVFSISLSAEVITFNADSMNGTAGNKSDTTTLLGNAFVKTTTMEISADKITLSGEEFRTITADGNVTAKNTETKLDFECGRLSYDRETKIAVLNTNVRLTDTENQVTASAQMIEYNQNSETAVLQINIELKQKDNVCTGAFAIYHKDIQTLELSGSPKIQQGDDTFRAQEIALDLNSQEITLNGRVQGTVTSTKKVTTTESVEVAENTEVIEEETTTIESNIQETSEELEE